MRKIGLKMSLLMGISLSFCLSLLGHLMSGRFAVSHGAEIAYGPMLLRSMITSLVVGYILIFLLMPLFLKWVLRDEEHEGST